jgi:hypothetical protein
MHDRIADGYGFIKNKRLKAADSNAAESRMRNGD